MFFHKRPHLCSASPVVYHLLRDCHHHARKILHEHSFSTSSSGAVGSARTLYELQLRADRFFSAVDRTIFLPRDAVHEVEDLPMFLIRAVRRHAPGGASLSEEAIVGGFIDWLDTFIPPREMSGASSECISFARLMRLVQSFVLYHRGVQWGEGKGAAYRLHPWHGAHCPSAREEQMPFVHLLQWLMRAKPTAAGKKITQEREKGDVNDYKEEEEEEEERKMKGMDGLDEEAMRAWHATESFSPPKSSAGFAALDIGAHSGYMTDLLLKAGATTVIGTDVTAVTLGNAEATAREHLRERRSRAAGHTSRTIAFVRCDVVPETETVATSSSSSFASSQTLLNDREMSRPVAGATSATAAQRRRAAARLRHIPLNGDLTNTSAPLASAKTARGPFDLLVFHPPVAPLLPVWPFHAAPSQTPHSFHPHSRATALHALLQRLLHTNSGKVFEENGREKSAEEKREEGIVRVGGYVAFVLPRVMDARVILQPRVAGKLTADAPIVSLGDFVTSALEGSYKLILRRRHSLAGMVDVVREDFTTYLQHFADTTYRKHIQRELETFYRKQQYVELLVLRKLEVPHAAPSNPHRKTTSSEYLYSNALSPSFSTRAASPSENALVYDETFEFTEYIPPGGPPLSHHWTELTPSYSFLNDEFFDSSSAQRNFLATGHTLAAAPVSASELNKKRDGGYIGEEREEREAQKGRADVRQMERNAQNYKSLFSEDLKKRRGGRIRKMAMQPLERQEWFIDEKLVKSEAAKVDLINELARFDLQDWD